MFEQTPGVVDVDWYVEAPQPKWTLVVDDEKAAAAGLSPAAVAAVVRMAGAGEPAGCCTTSTRASDVPIVLRLPRARPRLARRPSRDPARWHARRSPSASSPRAGTHRGAAASITRTCCR